MSGSRIVYKAVKRTLRYASFVVVSPFILIRIMLDFFRLHYWPRLRVSVGPGCLIDSQTWLVNGKNIELGREVKISAYSTVIAGTSAKVRIGDFTMIGPGVVISAINHGMEIGGIPFRYQNWEDGLANSINIERNVWIGANAVILPGVTVGENSVVGAGTVVADSIPPNSIATMSVNVRIRKGIGAPA